MNCFVIFSLRFCFKRFQTFFCQFMILLAGSFSSRTLWSHTHTHTLTERSQTRSLSPISQPHTIYSTQFLSISTLVNKRQSQHCQHLAIKTFSNQISLSFSVTKTGRFSSLFQTHNHTDMTKLDTHTRLAHSPEKD